MKQTLTSILEEIIASNDFVEDGLANGYINTAGYAEYMHPFIQERMWEKHVTVEAIKMSLSRVRKKISQKEIDHTISHLFTWMTVKKKVHIIYFESHEKHISAFKGISPQKWHYIYKMIWWVQSFIVYEDYYSDQIGKEFNQIDITEHKKNLWLLSFNIEEIKKWLSYKVSKWLYMNWIRNAQLIKDHTHYTVLVDWKDLQKAYHVLCVI